MPSKSRGWLYLLEYFGQMMLKRSCRVTNNCVSVEYPDLNPWFSRAKGTYLSN